MKFISVLSFREALGQPLSMLSFWKSLGEQYLTKPTNAVTMPRSLKILCFRNVCTLASEIFQEQLSNGASSP
jgi:hypothetical protein